MRTQMKTHTITRLARLVAAAALSCAAPGLLAQGAGGGELLKAYISIGQNFAHGHGLDLTQKTWGGVGAYTAEAGLQFEYDAAGVQVRPNLGYARILGDYIDRDIRPTYDLFGIFVGFDIVYKPPVWGDFSVTAGPSFHFWSVEEVNAIGPANRSERNGKFGWRLGVGYDILPDLRVDLTYTATEWRSRSDLRWNPGFNPSLPAYFTVKASYRL
jgi:hypothetical protein